LLCGRRALAVAEGKHPLRNFVVIRTGYGVEAPMIVSGAAVLEFEDYVRARQDALLRSARRLVPDPTDAQDLVQTALARTYPRWEGIADKSLADAYMRRVMINTRTEWWCNPQLDEVHAGELPDARFE